jgi:hypothetical protein
MPQPELGKHYNLTHKKTSNNPFRGYVQVVGAGFLGGLKIFRTSQNGNNWYFWDDYHHEYIGDLA